MSIVSKISKIRLLVCNPQIITSESKYIFLLSHMRSRSSLISHILGSNPDIIGYYEFHSSYLTQMDLIKTRIKLFREFKCRFLNKYIYNKILQNKHIIDYNLFDGKLKLVFLIREPERTIKSIINMSLVVDGEWHDYPNKILNYYISRLLFLQNYAKVVKGDFFFIDSDDFMINTDTVLDNLSNWLELREPLKKEYLTFNKTGKPGPGDFSEHIKTGVVKETVKYPNITLDPEIIQKARVVYEKCKKNLSLKCI